MKENAREKKYRGKVKRNKKINLKLINYFICYFKLIYLIFPILCKC